MAVVIAGKTIGLGEIIALIILILAIVFMVIGHISPFAILAMIAGLALAILL